MSIKRKKVLIYAVLNWGLGHATRSIPVIHQFIDQGFKVVIASDGRAAELLKREFTHLEHRALMGYKVRYPFKSMFANLLYQWPKLIRAMVSEHWAIGRLAREFRAAIIISDNRYGCFSSDTINVFMTHQINPLTGRRWLDNLARWCSRWLLKNFDHVWIPDDPALGPLSGSMVEGPPDHASYIGLLSRFSKEEKTSSEYDLLAVISGPEPARTRFELKLIEQLVSSDLTCRIVRGRTEGFSRWHQITDKVCMTDFLTSQELEKELNRAKMVVSRSGYTSLMDYMFLGKKALVVPTPGQYEQEYLAKHLPPLAPLIGQREEEMDLAKAWSDLDRMEGSTIYRATRLSVAVNDLIRSMDFA